MAKGDKRDAKKQDVIIVKEELFCSGQGSRD
ncbi:MAG: hypothetical protein JWQ09_2909 [Segetibacter sp.]|nr:hypothetical protein [Segetibacter sp.]